MARYLSPEWFAAARRPLPEAPVAILEQVVTDGPEGTVVYRVHSSGREAAIEWPVPDGAPAPDLRVTSDWVTAVEVARGTLSTQRALMEGRLKVGGNASRLTGCMDAVAGADPLDPAVRSETTFELS
jgi:hypothetical protein